MRAVEHLGFDARVGDHELAAVTVGRAGVEHGEDPRGVVRVRVHGFVVEVRAGFRV